MPFKYVYTKTKCFVFQVQVDVYQLTSAYNLTNVNYIGGTRVS